MKDKKNFLKISLPINNYQLIKRNTESNLRVTRLDPKKDPRQRTSTNSTYRVGCGLLTHITEKNCRMPENCGERNK